MPRGTQLRLKLFLLLSAGAFCAYAATSPFVHLAQEIPAKKTGKIDFNRDIRPILSDNCIVCHGPDAAHKKIKLRLDSEDAAKADLGRGRRAIVPHHPEQSQVVKRITATDDAMRMPLLDAGRNLTPQQIELLTEWIRQGVQWQGHWSFIAPVRSPLPEVKNKAWLRNAIDYFVLARLEGGKEGLKVHFNLVCEWADDSIRVEAESTVALHRWQHILVSYDGARTAQGVRVFIDGQPQQLRVHSDTLYDKMQGKAEFCIGGVSKDEGQPFTGLIDEVRVYNRVIAPPQAAVLACGESLTELARLAPEQRTDAQKNKLRWAFLEQHAPLAIRQAWTDLSALRERRQKLVESFPTVMVMQERAAPRDTFLLKRGAYDAPGEQVTRGVPAVLPPLPADAPNNRLGLARWLVHSSNPLTARVQVNRFWQMFFGTGLV